MEKRKAPFQKLPLRQPRATGPVVAGKAEDRPPDVQSAASRGGAVRSQASVEERRQALAEAEGGLEADERRKQEALKLCEESDKELREAIDRKKLDLASLHLEESTFGPRKEKEYPEQRAQKGRQLARYRCSEVWPSHPGNRSQSEEHGAQELARMFVGSPVFGISAKGECTVDYGQGPIACWMFAPSHDNDDIARERKVFALAALQSLGECHPSTCTEVEKIAATAPKAPRTPPGGGRIPVRKGVRLRSVERKPAEVKQEKLRRDARKVFQPPQKAAAGKKGIKMAAPVPVGRRVRKEVKKVPIRRVQKPQDRKPRNQRSPTTSSGESSEDSEEESSVERGPSPRSASAPPSPPEQEPVLLGDVRLRAAEKCTATTNGQRKVEEDEKFLRQEAEDSGEVPKPLREPELWKPIPPTTETSLQWRCTSEEYRRMQEMYARFRTPDTLETMGSREQRNTNYRRAKSLGWVIAAAQAGDPCTESLLIAQGLLAHPRGARADVLLESVVRSTGYVEEQIMLCDRGPGGGKRPVKVDYDEYGSWVTGIPNGGWIYKDQLACGSSSDQPWIEEEQQEREEAQEAAVQTLKEPQLFDKAPWNGRSPARKRQQEPAKCTSEQKAADCQHNKEPCKFFFKGNGCARGDQCWFCHVCKPAGGKGKGKGKGKAKGKGQTPPRSDQGAGGWVWEEDPYHKVCRGCTSRRGARRTRSRRAWSRQPASRPGGRRNPEARMVPSTWTPKHKKNFGSSNKKELRLLRKWLGGPHGGLVEAPQADVGEDVRDGRRHSVLCRSITMMSGPCHSLYLCMDRMGWKAAPFLPVRVSVRD